MISLGRDTFWCTLCRDRGSDYRNEVLIVGDVNDGILTRIRESVIVILGVMQQKSSSCRRIWFPVYLVSRTST